MKGTPRAIFVRKGNCRQCGKCCTTEYVYGVMTLLEKINLRWKLLMRRSSFDIQSQCGFLKMWKGGNARCTKYHNRPDFCKQFPNSPKDLIPGCGYRFELEVREDHNGKK